MEVIIYSSPDDKKKNRGFCFLEYESHKSASLAKRRLGTGRIKVSRKLILIKYIILKIENNLLDSFSCNFYENEKKYESSNKRKGYFITLDREEDNIIVNILLIQGLKSVQVMKNFNIDIILCMFLI